VSGSSVDAFSNIDGSGEVANTRATSLMKRPTWEQAEGSPLPLGVNWIEKEQAFNFAVHSEHAESVALLLYSPADLVTPLLRLQLDFLHNKSKRIWHCRIPAARIGEARYYAYSVSGETTPQLHSFDPQKILLDPYAKSIFFPPGFDRNLAMREGSNAGRAPLGVLTDQRSTFDWSGTRPQYHESDAVIYELHVKGFTKNPNSGIDPSRAGTYAGLVEKIRKRFHT
jgi:isoamylase